MIEHIWTVLCESAAVDNESGNVSTFNAIATIAIEGDPEKIKRLPLRFDIISFWMRSSLDISTKGKLRLTFSIPNDERKQQIEMPIDLKETTFHYTRIHSNGIVVKGSGIYKFFVEKQEEGQDDWTLVATIPFLLQFTSPANPQK